MKTRLLGRIGSVLATPAMVAHHRKFLLEAQELADRIVVLSNWMYESLRSNGIRQEKMVVCRHGVNAGETVTV